MGSAERAGRYTRALTSPSFTLSSIGPRASEPVRDQAGRGAGGFARKPLSSSRGHAISGRRTDLVEWEEATMMKMTIEPVSAFSSLDVLVAMDEGLFSAEGLDLQMASRESRDIRSTTEGTLTSPVTNQGRLQERGEATMFQG
jgi:hypothetical protein